MTDHEFASVRYIVDDVAASFDFYTKLLGFAELNNFAPAFADVARGPLRLLLSGPTSSGARALLGGRQPCPVAGTGYTSSSMISAARSNDCSQQASSSAARSSRAQAAHRSCSTIRPATRSSCSKRHHDRLLDQQRARRPRSGHHCPDDRGQGVGRIASDSNRSTLPLHVHVDPDCPADGYTVSSWPQLTLKTVPSIRSESSRRTRRHPRPGG